MKVYICEEEVKDYYDDTEPYTYAYGVVSTEKKAKKWVENGEFDTINNCSLRSYREVELDTISIDCGEVEKYQRRSKYGKGL